MTDARLHHIFKVALDSGVIRRADLSDDERSDLARMTTQGLLRAEKTEDGSYQLGPTVFTKPEFERLERRAEALAGAIF